MNLSTTYLGLDLPHPIIAGASPLVDDVAKVRALEDAGASAIVMHSLFEEQLVSEQEMAVDHVDTHQESSAEALSYLPNPSQYRLGPADYLDQIHRLKSAVNVPVIASLNGNSLGGWLKYAKLMQEAGADALELNMYFVATDTKETATIVEKRTLDVVREVKRQVHIPLAVKLSPFYSALPNFAQELDALQIGGLVLFNRFYQPDIDLDNLEVKRSLQLSDSSELLLRLRWLAILSGRVRASLAVTGGVHSAIDAIKSVMVGAHAVQMVSALLLHGPVHIRTVVNDMRQWLEEHEYESLAQMQGSMGHSKCPDPRAFERSNYIEILQSWRPQS